MRVMLDTNVLISYAIFGPGTIGRVVEDAAANHTPPLSTYVIDEFREVVASRWPERSSAVERFLARAPFETVVTPKVMEGGLFEIRDKLDYPVLYSAIIGFADVLATGDKDFAGVDTDTPAIVTPALYFGKVCRVNALRSPAEGPVPTA